METAVNVYNANVRVRDLSRDVDNELNRIAARDQKEKWLIVREALEEYVKNHK